MEKSALPSVQKSGSSTRRNLGLCRRLWYRYGILWTSAIAVGLCAVGYAHLMDVAYRLFLSVKLGRIWAPLIVTPAIGGMSAWLTTRHFQGSEGSGIPQVIGVLRSSRGLVDTKLLGIKVACGKIAVSVLAMAGGFAIGREGPTVQISATIMYSFRRLYPKRLRASSRRELERRLILAGAASGLAAAFNTPLAGIAFAIEQLSCGFDVRTARVTVIATILSGLVALAIDGNYTFFGNGAIGNIQVWPSTISVFVTGTVTGIAGGVFTWITLNIHRWLPRLVVSLRDRRPVAFGMLCGAIVAIFGVLSGGYTYGSGYAEAASMVAGHTSVPGMYPIAKCASLIVTSLVGASGGIFVPSLAIGAGIGQNIHEVLNQVSSKLAITLAMVGFLSAVTQSPITAFVIVTEMNDAHVLITPLMATSVIASTLSRAIAPHLYETLALRYTN